MLNQAVGSLLPAAAAVALSPIPIIAVVVVLSTPRARTTGPAFALGWIAGLTAVSAVVVLLAGGADDPHRVASTGLNWLQVAIGVVFLVMAAKQWRKRPKDGAPPDEPKWMSTIDSLRPARAFVLGVALSGANPKNLALTLAAAASIAQADLGQKDTVTAVAVFVALGSLTVAGSVLFYLVAPGRAVGPLAGLKKFMTDNSAVIMMVVLLLIGAKLLGDGLAGVWD